MNAGSSIDCDIAAANGSRKNAGICKAMPPPPGGPEAPSGNSGNSEVMRDVMNEAMPALPNTAPT